MSSRATLSSASHFSVCVSYICHYPLDGYICDASTLCFCSTDFLAESNLFHPTNFSIFPACTRFPGSCAPVRSSNSYAHCVADSSLRSKTGSLGDGLAHCNSSSEIQPSSNVCCRSPHSAVFTSSGAHVIAILANPPLNTMCL